MNPRYRTINGIPVTLAHAYRLKSDAMKQAARMRKVRRSALLGTRHVFVREVTEAAKKAGFQKWGVYDN